MGLIQFAKNVGRKLGLGDDDDKKVQGQEISVTETQPETGGKVIDLMEALRASLGKKAASPAKAAPAETRKPAKRAQQAEPAQRKAAKK